MARAIDLMHLGVDRVICAYEVDGLVIDPGPESCLETLVEALGGPPRALLLTHIHLDHAGATGAIVERFGDLPVYVHERGAPHMIDPSRLIKSATQLYGDRMERLWGRIAPVPERNLRILTGGETVEGFRVEYTPGHAANHVSFLHEATGDAYVGDTAGVRIPPTDYVLPPTPPPEVDLDAWAGSVDKLQSWQPAALCITHFGRFEGVEDHLLRTREGLARWGELTRAHGREAFIATLEAELAAIGDDGVGERMMFAVPAEQLWTGLERYWRKRDEREAAA